MHRGRVRRWTTRVVLAAVFGVAALGAWRAGTGHNLLNEIVWGIEIVWGVTGEKPGP
jgi:hypothetical protein